MKAVKNLWDSEHMECFRVGGVFLSVIGLKEREKHGVNCVTVRFVRERELGRQVGKM
jgi:hypothetical protein